MGIHRSREHCLDIAKTLQTADIKKPPKCLTTGVLEFLGLDRGDYIRIHLIPILTYLTSSLQTSLQNQTKREGNEKMTLLLNKLFLKFFFNGTKI